MLVIAGILLKDRKEEADRSERTDHCTVRNSGIGWERTGK
jgi:hypothetical protein